MSIELISHSLLDAVTNSRRNPCLLHCRAVNFLIFPEDLWQLDDPSPFYIDLPLFFSWKTHLVEIAFWPSSSTSSKMSLSTRFWNSFIFASTISWLYSSTVERTRTSSTLPASLHQRSSLQSTEFGSSFPIIFTLAILYIFLISLVE